VSCAQVLEIGDDGAVRKIGGGWSTASETPRARTSTPYRAAFEAAAGANGLDPDFLTAVARTESGLNPDAVSSAGAIGLMQLMPATARGLGVDPRVPQQNIMGGARHLRALLDRFDGQIDLALAAYNAGSGAVTRRRRAALRRDPDLCRPQSRPPRHAGRGQHDWRTSSMKDPAGSGPIIAALSWVQGTLLGNVATAVAVIAVAMVGFMMLTGRINWRMGATVVLGCFILFGATTIVGGIQAAAG